MDLAAVFALSLLGGYFFAAWWRLTAFATRRYEGHHLYFRAAFWGVIFYVLALVLRTYVIQKVSWLKGLDGALIDYVKPALKEETGVSPTVEGHRAERVATALYSLILGPLSAWILNVGLVVSITDPDDEPTVLVLLPMFSGYRDSQSRVVLTSDYEDVYKRLRDPAERERLKLPHDWTREFQITLRADAVISANLFSAAVYAQFNPDWKQQIAQHKAKAPPQEVVVRIKREPRPS